MASDHDLPWVRINDFLLEIGSVRDPKDYWRTLLNAFETVLPFDVTGVIGIVDAEGIPMAQENIGTGAYWANAYNEYYYQVMPKPVDFKQGLVINLDWSLHAGSEYVVDFLAPQGVTSSLSVTKLGTRGVFDGSIALHRSRAVRPFSTQDMRILEIIRPHIRNFWTLLSVDRGSCGVAAGDLRSAHGRLTRREAEVAALLCNGCTTEEVASRLRISRLTVYKHLENMFAKFHVNNRSELRSVFMK